MSVITNLSDAFVELINAYKLRDDLEKIGKVNKCDGDYCWDIVVFADPVTGLVTMVALVNNMKSNDLSRIIVYNEGKDGVCE